MSNLLQRIITGFIFVIVIVGAIYFHPLSFAALFFLITILTQFEFFHAIEQHTPITPQKYYGVLISGLWYLFSFFAAFGLFSFKIGIIFIPLIFLIFINQLFKISSRPVHNITYTIAGIFYISSFSLLNFLVFPNYFLPYPVDNYSYEIVLGIFILIWVNDTMAYITGSLLGKTKLFPRISPKKTWEGTIGGIIFTLVAAVIWTQFQYLLSLYDWLLIGLICSVIGTLGDLSESLVKRALGIKDSGKILPGHGGFLDRFDSLLMVSPFVFAYLYLKY